MDRLLQNDRKRLPVNNSENKPEHKNHNCFSENLNAYTVHSATQRCN